MELQAKRSTVACDSGPGPGHSVGEVILADLAQAKAAILTWDAASVDPEGVRSEASRAKAAR